MATRVCRIGAGYLLLNPLRRLFENPDTILSPYIHEGMTVMEPRASSKECSGSIRRTTRECGS